MRIAFFASGISPHISEFCDELYRIFGDDFRFFGTDKEPIKAMYIMGAGNLHKEKKYFYNVNDSKTNQQMSIKWAEDADVAIVGCSNCYKFIEYRFHKGDKLTFKLRERLFKNGNTEEFNELLKKKIDNQFLRYKDNNLYYLCAGTFAPYDFVSIGIPREKLIYWGYYPRVSNYSIDELSRCYSGKITLVWVGRFVREKLSINAIIAVENLIVEGYDVELKMIGYGEEQSQLEKYVDEHKISDRVWFLGAMDENSIRAELRKAHIFIMTSNYEEGWGAVVNEAMSEGCVPVCSYAAGASLMLIDNIESGILYHYDDVDDLKNKIVLLLNNRNRLAHMSRKAYESIVNEWNGKVAAQRLLQYIKGIQREIDLPFYKTGPCRNIKIYTNEDDVEKEVDSK